MDKSIPSVAKPVKIVPLIPFFGGSGGGGRCSEYKWWYVLEFVFACDDF